jgi:cob(I)alamin adenosyltransferase
MKIYTRKGDRGETATLGGGRLLKSDARIRALGMLDELNATFGVVLSDPGIPAAVGDPLRRIQSILFEAGAALASPDPSPSDALFATETAWLEQVIDQLEAELPALTRFILPGGTRLAAELHRARAVARRAECQAVEAAGGDEGRGPFLAWVNRLSDALFVFARTANRLAGVEDVAWESRSGR